jgi:uncharacterized protein YggE
MYGMSGGMQRPYGGINTINSLQLQMMDKKGKMRAEDFDAAFAQAAALYQAGSPRIEEVQDVTESLANATIEDTSKQAASMSGDFKT